ncbi:hypothetical protein GTP46_11210 [Duganella sp. FT135W]|uniref:Uncharacterized protein n=1 Tax=Duganella flavida TaxID=2692175 RepID=A0A6L8KBI9_9BURK|nr:hypothetical protein [Duganella flavida]
MYLVVSKYEPLDKLTGKGGRNIPKTVAKFSAELTEMPSDLPVTLNDDDVGKIMRKAIIPARERAVQRIEMEAATREAEAMHAVDPNWRLQAAIESLDDVLKVVDVEGPSLDFGRLANLFTLCTQIGLVEALPTPGVSERTAQLMMLLAESIAEVAQKIEAEGFPLAGDGNIKESSMYKAWMEIGAARQALQTAMQKKRYVQTRSGESTKVVK